jgi:hypothetical protein
MTASTITAWTETAMITIASDYPSGTTATMQISAITETIDIDLGDKDIEGIPNLAGGRCVKITPEADTTITFEGYPIGAGLSYSSASNAVTGLQQEFFGGTLTTTEPVSLTNTTYANGVPHHKFTVYVLWTDDSTVTTAKSATAANCAGLRYTFSNCYMVSYKTAFTDGILKSTFKFKCAARSRAGAGNIKVESTDGNAILPAL